ncbi:RNA polymerase sigma factor [Brevundimonas variabilis]|uniref:RNA polymerase sigma-70 factor (ECF subfamily) n=1 Tax=Brevundimonas variabilis TaxID=74312 RepID=A0A7W9FEN7_9CAUL|nr:RNA polymerase sigma factor [Brevundimonas variabilis]MBB5746532.1 RNA polymerase sigma-70 factor (ECF subfamily) [Brevundimonas variabilis]
MSDAKELEPEGDGLGGLYRRYAAWLGRRLRTHVNAEDAADIVQETYLRIAPMATDTIRHPKSLLLRVATNLMRNNHRRQALMDSARRDFGSDDTTSAPQSQQVLLKQIILTMPTLYQDVFVLSRFGGMTYQEIADLKGLSVQAVQWRMSKALEHCTARLDE